MTEPATILRLSLLLLPVALLLLVPIGLRAALRAFRNWRVRRYLVALHRDAAAARRRAERPPCW